MRFYEAYCILKEIRFNDEGDYISDRYYKGIGQKRNEALFKVIHLLELILEFKETLNGTNI